MNDKAGQYKTQLSGDMQYKSFVPTPLIGSSLVTVDEELVTLLSKANRMLGMLDGISSMIPNIELFLSMYIRKEALLSSQIEGMQATLDDILDPSAEENQNVNISDVLNYIKATSYATKSLETLPLCNRLLQEIHEVLMNDIRGGDKNPGEFRRSQNWIGPAGSAIKNASYIPPSPEDMVEAMSDLEKFINADDDIDPIIKAALIHYQFETIHPFLDGNGRIGRLLIILFLCEKQVLKLPVLYISYFLKLNRVEYYDRLMEVRNKGSYEQWIKFFTKALLQSAEDAVETINALTALREKNVELISTLGKSAKTAKRLYDYLEKSPIIVIKKTSAELSLSFNTVSKSVDKLVELDILRLTENVKRGRCFAYEKYLEILRKDT